MNTYPIHPRSPSGFLVDDDERERLLNAEANALWEKLRMFAPGDRLFVLSDIMSRVTRKLRTRESTRYAVDFTRDEAPTDPERRESDRTTRAINVDELRKLADESKRK
jgi:hypothetical protein